MTLPEGTTWLDLVTLFIAVLAVYLTVRRDRALAAVRVEIEAFVNDHPLRYSSGDRDLGLRIKNVARRTVTIERAGLSRGKHRDSFPHFRDINFRRSSGGGIAISDPPLPKTLEPGDPAYVVNAPLHKVKEVFLAEPPKWAWCEDTYGTAYWARIPADVRQAVARAKRRRPIQDGAGGFTEEEIEDDAEL
jgi:hypothetical protein